MKNKKFLSIGSVVMLKGAKKALMIIGFCAGTSDEKEKKYDYLGCLYPVGVFSEKSYFFFNHDDIDKVIYLGYTDQEDKEFRSKLLKEMGNN